jgi:hypothetical protein
MCASDLDAVALPTRVRVPFRAGASGHRTTAFTINGARPAGLQRSPALIAGGDEARDRRVDGRGHDAGAG